MRHETERVDDTQTRARIEAHTYTYIHTYTHIYIHIYTIIHTHTYTHTHTHTYIPYVLDPIRSTQQTRLDTYVISYE